MSGSAVVALDIGGTKLAAAIVDADGGLSDRIVVPTPAAGTADEMWDAVASLVGPFAATGAAAIGVGCGGPMRRGGSTVSPLNIGAWHEFPLFDRLATFGLPVAIDNDAKALALGEGRWGAAVGVDHYLAMVVSTGVGAGIVLDGRLLDGADGNAGHIGHVIVEPGGRECACGARGCLEAEASGPQIEAMTGAPPAEATVDVRRRTGMLVGRLAVASVCNLLDLRLALVAGSVALGFGDDFFDAAQAEIDRSSRISFSRGARIAPCGLGADGPVLGAAAVGFRALVTHE